ncbi:MAG: hypothetical protein WCP20_17860 [Desulfuromonadales bacterium]
MKSESLLLWAVRISWPLLGGVWGAVAGFGGYHGLADNADSFGTMFAQGFFITTAIIGLFAGAACGVLVGGLTEKLLRYLGVWASCAVCVATVVNALVIWQLIGIVQTKYPGFRSPVTKPHAGARGKGQGAKPKESSTHKRHSENPCAQPPPPENSKERASWDAECR